MIELDRIYNEDCLKGMERIDTASVDLVICDLPYGTTRNKWDVVIDPAALWAQYLRITRENAAIILFGQGMFTARMMMSQPSMWRYNLIWKKGERTSGFLNAGRMPLRNHEDIMVFYRRQPVYHPQMTTGKPLHSRGTGVHRHVNNNYGKFDELEDLRANCTEKYPKSIVNFDRPHPPVHPTQKPVELYEWLIRTYSDEGAVVLDNCCGSGTVGIAAHNTGRHFIGFENSKEYFNIAVERLHKTIGYEY